MSETTTEPRDPCDEADELLAAATPGEWSAPKGRPLCDSPWNVPLIAPGDLRLIVRACSPTNGLLRELVAEVRRLRAIVEEGAKDEPAATVRRNCWACAHDEGGMCIRYVKDVARWADAIIESDDGMPPRDADGCPGWAPKAGTPAGGEGA